MASPPFYIQSTEHNRVFDVSGGDLATGSRIVLAKKKGKGEAGYRNQFWQLQSDRIVSAASNTAAIDCNPGLVKGAELIIRQTTDAVSHEWEWSNGHIRSTANHDLVMGIEEKHIVLQELTPQTTDKTLWKLVLENGSAYDPHPPPTLPFEPSVAKIRVEKLWDLDAEFGVQQQAYHVFLEEIVSDRYCLVNGLQLLRDELQLAFANNTDLIACAADLKVPTVITTLAHTNCGDRINQGSVSSAYKNIVESRFSTLAEDGGLKTEIFSPAGGGTDNGGVLAHVTVAHQLDNTIRKLFYEGNPKNFVLVNIDLMTHVGCDTSLLGGEEENVKLTFGKAKESVFRDPRNACGAIIGSISNFDERNGVHQRLHKDMGQENLDVFQKKRVFTVDGETDITYVVAAAIVAIRGLHDTCDALAENEMDERGVAHLTASVTINNPDNGDLIYVARATVFYGEIKIQGLGLEAAKYSGKVERKKWKELLEINV